MTRPAVLAAAAGLLAAAFFQMHFASAVTSATVDEPAHVTSGYLSLARFDLTINREHPPLTKMIAALPLLLLHPALPAVTPDAPPPGTEDFEFDYSRKFLYRANRPDEILAAARAPIMLLTLALGALVFLWARDLAGDAAGLAALFLYCLEPNILAHGRLVTTDMGAAAFSTAFLFALRRALRGGSTRSYAVTGLLLGLALLSKFSTLLLIPLAAALSVADRLMAPRAERPPTAPVAARTWILRAAILLAVAWLVLEAGYGFGGFPLPRLYSEGLALARAKNATVEGPTYLHGAISPDGFRSYFLVALAVKTPIPILIFGATGIFALAASRKGREGALFPLFGAAAWIVAMSVLTRAQIGYRYVLPAIPLLCVLGGVGGAALWGPGSGSRAGLRGWGRGARVSVARGIAATLAMWLALSAVSIYPYHLAYFNEIAGGPDNGWKWLVDSSLDWGQDLVGLKRRLDSLGDPVINLFYFGTADPDALGIRHFPYGENRPGLFAVSATHLAGVYLPDPDYLADFRSMRPVETIGHSIILYRLDAIPERLKRPLTRDR
ncbi:MAG: glycosyltransferase family 39 protein [Acidobacteria bacterium]|nr:glycosyltransferase family 39 protein [Acidobacteriota bacterium]